MGSGVILVGVDGSPTAARAADAAGLLAAALRRDLLVLSAFSGPELGTVRIGGDEFEISASETASQVAEEISRALGERHRGVQVDWQVVPGRPADALVEAARDKDASLIVVGNKRVQGPARILGSIAADVAQKAPCDVYIAYTHRR